MDQHTRLLVKVSRLYFERDMKQQEIADTLAISQARVSRLIKEAKERGIVRSVVVVPTGVHAELEDQLEAKLSLTQAVVVDTDDARSVEQALGTATADYLTSTVTGDAVIGVSTWSSSLISALQSMRPASKHMARLVIQMFGGVGNPDVQYEATRLTSDLARVLGAEPQFVPAPAVWVVNRQPAHSKRIRTFAPLLNSGRRSRFRLSESERLNRRHFLRAAVTR